LQRHRPTIDLTETVETSDFSFGPTKRRGWEQKPIKEIIEQLQGTSNNPIDLTDKEQSKMRAEAIRMAKRTVLKYIYFSENVRPAYFGTYTAPLSLGNLQKLARNPALKIAHIDYDYDSEAEWEDEEGDDVSSTEEEEEELEDDGDDDSVVFIDDADVVPGIHKGLPTFATELIPTCSGLLWEDAKGTLHSADGSTLSMDYSQFEMESLIRKYILQFLRLSNYFIGPEPKTIDPFSVAYWGSTTPQTKKTAQSLPSHRPALVDKTKQLNSVSGLQSLKAARYVPEADLDAFKQAIDGQDLTKVAMIEHLKKL
jgi:chromatin assembly factor 1 subunit A